MVANLYNAGRRIYHGGMGKVLTTTEAAALVGVSGVLVALRYREGWSLGVGAISLMVAALLVHRPQVGP